MFKKPQFYNYNITKAEELDIKITTCAMQKQSCELQKIVQMLHTKCAHEEWQSTLIATDVSSITKYTYCDSMSAMIFPDCFMSCKRTAMLILYRCWIVQAKWAKYKPCSWVSRYKLVISRITGVLSFKGHKKWIFSVMIHGN